MLKRYLLIGLFTAAATACAATSAEQPVMQVRVFFDNPDVPRLLIAAGYDVVYIAEDFADIFTREEGVGHLRKTGYGVAIIHSDVVAHYASRLDLTGTIGSYKTLAEIYDYLDNMKAEHPGLIINSISIGSASDPIEVGDANGDGPEPICP